MKTIKALILGILVVLAPCKLLSLESLETKDATPLISKLPAKPITVQSLNPLSETIEINIDPGPLIVVVSKTNKTLVVRHQFKNDTIVCFTVRTGLNPGQKTKRGDKKSPEGKYIINGKYKHKYIRWLSLNYPNEIDIKAGRTGGEIGIHWLGIELTGRRARADGSSGCITVWKKEEILTLYDLLPEKTIVYIL